MSLEIIIFSKKIYNKFILKNFVSFNILYL